MSAIHILLKILQIVNQLEQHPVAKYGLCLHTAGPAGKKSVNKHGRSSLLNSQRDESVFGPARPGAAEMGRFFLRAMDGQKTLMHVGTARPGMLFADQCKQ